MNCLVCFEEDEVQVRHMLPCKCKLLLCEECVDKLSTCVYHRQPFAVTTLVNEVSSLRQSLAAQRLSCDDELNNLRQLTSSGTLIWLMFAFFTACAFIAQFVFLGLMLSLLSAAMSVCVLQAVFMSMDRRRPFFVKHTQCMVHAWVLFGVLVWTFS